MPRCTLHRRHTVVHSCVGLSVHQILNTLVSGELKVLKVGGMEYWNGIVEWWNEHVHDVITSRPELPLEPSAGSMVISQVTEAGRGIADSLIVVTDSEIDLDTSIKCVASPVKVVPGEMFFFFVWSIETLFRACLHAGVSLTYLHRAQCWSV